MQEVRWRRKLSALLRQAGEAQADVAGDPEIGGMEDRDCERPSIKLHSQQHLDRKEAEHGPPHAGSNLTHSKCKL